MEKLPKRKTIRLQSYDYRSKGVYLVTICTHDREMAFGAVDNGIMALNATGEIADRNVFTIAERYPEVKVIEHVVMPNHVHLLLELGTGANANYGVPTAAHSLGQIVRAYKASVTMACGNGRTIWQPRFYEHIIRNEYDLLETIEYIRNNPLAWEKDDLYSADSPRP